jgi:hypothetical protein
MLPVGVIADKVHRPKMLALAISAWSAFTLMASGASSYTELLATRWGS